jgi:tetratricopeptide (TPR) repeat protein
MGQKFFISFNLADKIKAEWIAWILKDGGHEVAVHHWELPAGGNVPIWMDKRLAWADRLIAVISPDYLTGLYSRMEWASQVLDDHDGTKGLVIPVIVKEPNSLPPLLNSLSRIDLTNCTEGEAKRRLRQGVKMPAPPQGKPAFEKVEGEAPDSEHTGPAKKPSFDVIGITFEQFQASVNKRVEETRAYEAEKRAQLQKLMELMERANSAEKESLQSQITAVEAEKRVLDAESRILADQLRNLQASHDKLAQKLAKAHGVLSQLAPLISEAAVEQARTMLNRGDVLGAENKFLDIADTARSRREQATEVEARAIFQAGELAEARIDWRTAYTHYTRAARLQPSNWWYSIEAGTLAHMMGDYTSAANFQEAAVSLATSKFGRDAVQTATALQNLATTYKTLAKFAHAETLLKQAMEIYERKLGKDHPDVARACSNLGLFLSERAKYDEARPLLERAIDIAEKAYGKDHPDVATHCNNLALFLEDQGDWPEAETFFRRAIEIDEKSLGKEHPNVATSCANLACLLKDHPKDHPRYSEAESFIRRAIKIGEKTLGKEHASVADWYNILAVLLKDQRKYDDAEPLYQMAVEIMEKTFGRDHPRVGTIYNNLALLFEHQGKYDDAKTLYQRALKIQEKAHGKDHPAVGTTCFNLAVLLQGQGKCGEAEPFIQRAISIFEASFGPEHPKTLLAKNKIGDRKIAR